MFVNRHYIEISDDDRRFTIGVEPGIRGVHTITTPRPACISHREKLRHFPEIIFGKAAQRNSCQLDGFM